MLNPLSVQINSERLWTSIQALGQIGADEEGGVTRLSLSNEELIGRQFVMSLMADAGLEVRQDEAGNLIGVLAGEDSDAAAIATGSHIDTVIQGGRFDGALGVLAGIEVLRTIKEQGIRHARPLEVICFTDEEGVRFGAGYLGSRAMSGGWNDQWLDLTDVKGNSLKKVMADAGVNPDTAALARRSRQLIQAYVELHIEQGRVLEALGTSVGIATAIYGHSWLEVTVRGRADHAGTTPMQLRQDPLTAAAAQLLAIEQLAVEHGGVATVGTLKLAPGVINVIPGEVVYSVDLRHEQAEKLLQMERAVREALTIIADEKGLSLSIVSTDSASPVRSSQTIIDTLADSCRINGLPEHYMVCGAGHDAVAMNELTEIGLILVRSRDGISHHPLEWSSPEDCADGANVLLHALIQLSI
ncbi:Zn-dependent hydrolase [Paenibacillus sp. GCM10012306]|uniref:Zn-dependent hydrolase n=1 Tax=Paenibacillus sp. GCM10012306 TaxID=3317342 RepID=UPI00361F70F9